MESARRASAIHEKRTGRALRITEADVINEEMYEEINDLPSVYRRLNAHLQTQSTEFDRRLLAYLSTQMATRQAVSDCWQDDQSHFNTNVVNSGTPQEPFSHGPAGPSPTGSMINYRQASYPLTTQEAPWRQRGLSTSTYVPGFDQQFPPSLFSSPFSSGRHMSLPSDSTLQPPHPTSTMPMDALNSGNMSRIDSAVDMVGSPQHLQHPTLPNDNDPKLSNQPWPAQSGYSVEPLSTTLPLDGQQFPTGSPQALNYHASSQPMSSPSQNFTNRRYSYNPNGKQKVATSSLPHLHSNHSATALPASGHASVDSSPLRPEMNYGSRPSTSCGGALLQTCHDAGGMGPDGTFTRNVLEETSDATAAPIPKES